LTKLTLKRDPGATAAVDVSQLSEIARCFRRLRGWYGTGGFDLILELFELSAPIDLQFFVLQGSDEGEKLPEWCPEKNYYRDHGSRPGHGSWQRCKKCSQSIGSASRLLRYLLRLMAKNKGLHCCKPLFYWSGTMSRKKI
jgi:hypothetical protein